MTRANETRFEREQVSAIIAARFNRLGMDALGCQVAVSLMVVSPISDKGTKSTRIALARQISRGNNKHWLAGKKSNIGWFSN